MRSSYRVWPAAVVAGLGAATAVVLAGSPAPGPGACAEGREWVAISPVAVPEAAEIRLVGYEERLVPLLAGCLDLDRLEPITPTDPRS